MIQKHNVWTHPTRGGKPHDLGGSFEGFVVRSVIGGSEDRGSLARFAGPDCQGGEQERA
jgi:hypothetical protein